MDLGVRPDHFDALVLRHASLPPVQQEGEDGQGVSVAGLRSTPIRDRLASVLGQEGPKRADSESALGWCRGLRTGVRRRLPRAASNATPSRQARSSCSALTSPRGAPTSNSHGAFATASSACVSRRMPEAAPFRRASRSASPSAFATSAKSSRSNAVALLSPDSREEGEGLGERLAGSRGVLECAATSSHTNGAPTRVRRDRPGPGICPTLDREQGPGPVEVPARRDGSQEPLALGDPGLVARRDVPLVGFLGDRDARGGPVRILGRRSKRRIEHEREVEQRIRHAGVVADRDVAGVRPPRSDARFRSAGRASRPVRRPPRALRHDRPPARPWTQRATSPANRRLRRDARASARSARSPSPSAAPRRDRSR